jgi:hypothetical protein
MRKQTKILMTVLVVGVTGALAGFGVFSAFSSTTTNPGNTFEAGTVTISDNDGSASLFSNATKAKPGDYDQCIKVTYGGSLDASVKLYTSAISADGSKVNITVHKGTGDNANCSDFSADGGALETSSTLSAFGTAHSNFSNGLAANPGAATKWVQNDTLTYRIRLTVPDSNASQAANITSFTLTWEAQNQ